VANLGFTLFPSAIGHCGIAWSEHGVIGVQLPEAAEADTRSRILRLFPGAQEAAPPSEVERAIHAITALLRGEHRADQVQRSRPGQARRGRAQGGQSGRQHDAPAQDEGSERASRLGGGPAMSGGSGPAGRQGGAGGLSAIRLDMSRVSSFRRLVYEAARAIAPGTTVSYGELAARIGRPNAARPVGQALACNPFAIIVPCHRVLAANGTSGGFSANGGVATKLRLLSLEGAGRGGPAVPGPYGAAGAAAAAPSVTGAATTGRTTPPVICAAMAGIDAAAAVEHLRAADPALRPIIDGVGQFRLELKTAPDTFCMLAEAIVYQQLSPKAAATIFGRLRALFPADADGFTCHRVFAASDDELRSAGLSRPKLLALRDLARRTAAGDLPTLAEASGMDDEAIIDRLIKVRGIGRWTAEMFLIFRLGRPDVLPLDDLGIRRGFKLAFAMDSLPERSEVERRGAAWRPYRTVASWYLWRMAGQPL
jgi:methylated-DNA-[protein]-cysteine S-methyltransferase